MNRTTCFIGVFFFSAWLCAQTEKPIETSLPPTTQLTEPTVIEEPITIIHLPDENGELVPIFGGITYDEIKAFVLAQLLEDSVSAYCLPARMMR